MSFARVKHQRGEVSWHTDVTAVHTIIDNVLTIELERAPYYVDYSLTTYEVLLAADRESMSRLLLEKAGRS